MFVPLVSVDGIDILNNRGARTESWFSGDNGNANTLHEFKL